MASTTPGGIELSTEHLDKTEQALSEVTTKASAQPEISPKESLHAPANHQSSHTWLRSFLPYKSLEEFENAWHMGNYVIDRKTGHKSFEEMSIYVRVSYSIPRMGVTVNIVLTCAARHASSVLRI
jgi:phosphatidylserine decarboxylase